MEVLWRLAYLLVVLGVGVAARQVGLLDGTRTDRLSAVAFYVALPALVFSSTYDRALGELVSPALVVGLWVVILGTAALAWVVHRRRAVPARRSVALVQSYHSNLGFLGLPLVAATLGGEATAVASVVLGVGALTQVPLTVFALVAINDADASPVAELRRVVANPVLLALGAGLVASTVGLTLRGGVTTPLDALSALALPLALVCVGASLRVGGAGLDPRATGSVVALKVGAMPALAWGTFSLLGVDPAAFAAVVVMLGTPSAVSTFVYANELGGDGGFASVNVFATTLVSVGTLLALVELVG